MKKICIVGGGTAGLISALILKQKFPNINIDIIKSDKIGIIGVGEGSTEHWSEFLKFCNIDVKEMINETNATLKNGVMFEGWTKNRYFHNIHEEFNCRYGQYLIGYAHAVKNNVKPEFYTSRNAFYDKVNPHFLPNQFHFNTFKLNEYLIKKCEQRNINIIDDEILDVIVEKGKIKQLKSSKKSYKYDFYVDSTGFKRVLISKLGAKWQSYKKYLPLNEAIAFQTPDTDEYPSYTLSKAMKYGWMWRIPTQGRWGNGYVFNNNYTNAEEAKKECEEYLGFEVAIGKNIKFEAGTIDKCWIGNCVAVGLSSSFIEPLEATSLGTTINQTFLLMHQISNYTQDTIDRYNKSFTQIVENIRDFVILHYMVKKSNSKFWQELKLNIPDTLKSKMNIWKNRMPIREDFEDNRYILFSEPNFAIILKELDLLDKKKIIKEYDYHNDNLKEEVERIFNYFREGELSDVGHKQYLSSLRT